jgi:uncharacterized protein (TIGR02145 family)
MTKTRSLSQALASLAFASIVLSGCSDSGTNDNDQGKSTQIEEQNPNDTGINVLTSVFPSHKDQNPYSVENMNKTFKNFILANNANAKNIPELEANFLYVRFLPYGKEGVYELKAYDTCLALFKHPMDYNKIRKPVVYIDKSLPDSIIPYFAAVPVGYEFGTTPYEILQELFLTQPLEEDEEDEQEGSHFVKAKKSNKANKAVATYLESQGLTPSQLETAAIPNSERLNAEIENNSKRILAKNTSIDTDNIVAWSLFPSKWRPSGTLTFKDDFLGTRPLVGIRVTAGYSFYWRSSKTDNNGYFSSPERWTFSVDYEANFDSQQFLLEDGHSWYGEDLEIEKNNKKSAWNETFNGNQAKWCIVWTAAWNYWYGNIYGLKRPRQNEWWNQSLDIQVYYKNNNDYDNEAKKNTSGYYRTVVIFEDISIQTYGRNHIQIYGTTIHEVAHSSHYWNLKAILGMSAVTYGLFPDILKETYADGIGRYLTNKHYGDGAWNKNYTIGKYTGLFEDLEDAYSTFAKTGYIEKECDKVSGITAPMVEKAVFKTTIINSWKKLKDSLINDYPNGTSNEEGGIVSYTQAAMDALFSYWETGNETPCPVPIADSRDGKAYRTITIGTQPWMAENLNYDVPGSRCYGDNLANCTTYGRLYDWTAAMTLPSFCNSSACPEQINAKHRGICPSGWHIPSVADWDKLMRYVDGSSGTSSPYDSPTAGKYLKTTSGWKNYNNNSSSYDDGNGTDYYGFSALPGGCYYFGSFKNIGYNGDWWSASEYDGSSAYRFDLYGGDKAGWEDIESNRKHDKLNLFSVRCVKD